MLEMEGFEGHAHEIELVPLDRLIVDTRVQRGVINERRVDHFAANWDDDAADIIVVSRRPNGLCHIIDGQHRFLGARRNGKVGSLRAKIFTDLWADGEILGLQREARIFRLLNTHTPVQAADKFRAEVVEGMEEAVAINNILNRHGLEVGGTTSYAFHAIATARRIARTSGGLQRLDAALQIIADAWNDNTEAYDGRILEGLVAFLARYEQEAVFERKRLVTKLAELGPTGPGQLIKKAQQHKSTVESGPMKNIVGQVIAGQYNKGQTKAAYKLPSWRP